MEKLKVRSLEANQLYMVQNKIQYKKDGELHDAYLGKKIAVIPQSLFLEYMYAHGVKKTPKISDDFIVMNFSYDVDIDHKDGKIDVTKQELRKKYYTQGVELDWGKDDINSVHHEKIIKYVPLYRTPNKAKKGSIVFIRENLFYTAIQYLTIGMYDTMNKIQKENPEAVMKLVELHAYMSLSAANAEHKLTVPFDNILIVNDQDVYMKEKRNAVEVISKDIVITKTARTVDFKEAEKNANAHGYTFYKKVNKDNPNLKLIPRKKAIAIDHGIELVYKDTTRKHTTKECIVQEVRDSTKAIKNTLFDGEGIIDASVFQYSDDKKETPDGFVYTRNHFWKSCLSVGNIQQYFKDCVEDYENATVMDMFDIPHKLSEIKVIVSNNSIKWLKFIDFMGGTKKEAYKYWKQYISDKDGNVTFAVVKTAHKSKWGKYQRSSYQMNNTMLATDEKEIEEILKDSIDYFNGLADNDNFLEYLKVYAGQTYKPNKALIALAEHNPLIMQAEFFKKIKKAQKSELKDRMKHGRYLYEGDNLTILHNPIGLLMAALGQDPTDDSCFEVHSDYIECYTQRFDDGELLGGFRSPHNSMNNIVALKNKRCQMLDKYFPDLGDNIIIINANGTDVQCRLNGQDADSDFVFVTNNKKVAELAQEAYKEFPTIVNGIKEIDAKTYHLTKESQAEMDNEIAANQYDIGTASDIAQLALSHWFDSGMCDKELKDTFMICSVLAQISIDSAKKSFEVAPSKMIRKYGYLKDYKSEIAPRFYGEIKELKEEEYGKLTCPVDIMADVFERNICKPKAYKTIYPEQNVMRENLVEMRKSRKFKRDLDKIQNLHKEIADLNKSEIDKDDIEIGKQALFDKLVKSMRGKFKTNDPEADISKMMRYVSFMLHEMCTYKSRMIAVLYECNPDAFLAVMDIIFQKDEKICPAA